MKFRYEELKVTSFILLFIDQIHGIAKMFPREEQFGLTSQVQRASTSVLLNLAEGTARKTGPEFKRFITMSLGSLVETHACLKIALRRSYVKQEYLEETRSNIHEIWRMLCGLRDSQH